MSEIIDTKRSLQEYLTSVRQRLEKATPGPWRVDFKDGDWYGVESLHPDYCSSWVCCNDEDATTGPNHGDAWFIAQAPTDIAKLLKIVEIMSGALEFYKTDAFHTKKIKATEALAEAEREIDDKS